MVSGAHFDSWWKRARQKQPDLLTFDPEMLVNEAAARSPRRTTPTRGARATSSLPLTYQFEPGAAADGVTVDVPVATLNQVDPTPFTWQVPGSARRSWWSR